MRGLVITSATRPGRPLREAAALLRAAGCTDVVVAVDGDGDDDVLPARWAAARAACPDEFVTVLAATTCAPRGAARRAARQAWLGAFDRVIDDDSAPDVGRGGVAPTPPNAVRRALVVTRAQPLHVGHVALVAQARAIAEEVVLVVAGAERAYTPRDPLSAGERLAQARAAFGHLGTALWLCAVPSPGFSAAALEELWTMVPRCEVVVARNPVLLAMAADAGLACERAEPARVDGDVVSSSAIRAALLPHSGDHATDGARGAAFARARVPHTCWAHLALLQQRLRAITAAEHG